MNVTSAWDLRANSCLPSSFGSRFTLESPSVIMWRKKKTINDHFCTYFYCLYLPGARASGIIRPLGSCPLFLCGSNHVFLPCFLIHANQTQTLEHWQRQLLSFKNFFLLHITHWAFLLENFLIVQIVGLPSKCFSLL